VRTGTHNLLSGEEVTELSEKYREEKKQAAEVNKRLHANDKEANKKARELRRETKQDLKAAKKQKLEEIKAEDAAKDAARKAAKKEARQNRGADVAATSAKSGNTSVHSNGVSADSVVNETSPEFDSILDSLRSRKDAEGAVAHKDEPEPYKQPQIASDGHHMNRAERRAAAKAQKKGRE
jgi:hypothetical protein